MADLGRALAEAGIRVVSLGRDEVVVDASELAAAAERLGAAAIELRAAWEAMPPGFRRYTCTIVLGGDEDEKGR